MFQRKKGYNFPLSQGGYIQGINDSGIETFNGSPKYFLTKETIQNSLDAKDTKINAPVKVSFKLSYIEKNKIPYISQLRKIIDNCREFWQQQDDKKTVNFMINAANILSNDKIPILEIADYNTTGLKGAKNFEKGSFTSLVKSSGVSNKDDNAGGSFGIGKNAPFSCSDIRTIIYSTLDNEGVTATQGVSRLVTHRRDNKLTQGVGFLGIEEEYGQYNDIINRPFIDAEANDVLDSYFIRKEVGTSVFALGYRLEENWEIDIIKSTIDFYMVAIQNGKLEVEVDDVLINKDTLGEVIEKYKEYWKKSPTLAYYKALNQIKDENATVEVIENPDFEGMGKIKLYIYANDDLPKKVAFVRGAGMKIIDKDRLGVTVQFAGVLVFAGHAINKFIRALENPSHDKIEYTRYKEKTRAKNILINLNKWIREQVNKLEVLDESESLDAEGIGQYLPDENEMGKVKTSIKEVLSKSLEQTKIKILEKPRKSRVRKNDSDETTTVGDKRPCQGGGTDSKPTIPGPKNPINNPGNERIIPIDAETLKIFLKDKANGIYRVIIKSKNKSNASIQIRIVGEVKSEVAEIISAKSEDGKNIQSTKELFGPVSFNRNEQRIFDVKLNYKNTYSMEVIPNADNI